MGILEGTGRQRLSEPPRESARQGEPLPPLFRYVWQHSRKEQLGILALVLISLPFYYVSLDLPKLIVNNAIQGRAFPEGRTTAPLFGFGMTLPDWLGGSWLGFPGWQLPKIEYLFALSAVFLLLVIVNSHFRYSINLRKGKLGEKVLRNLRFDLFSLLLDGRSEDRRKLKASEAATIIKDEVEPIGGFAGDAFVQPVFLGGQAITALAFIVVQNILLGSVTIAVLAVQVVLVPRLRREQLRLSRERQIRSRELAGHVGEIVDFLPEVENHGTAAYERHRIGGQLDHLFRIRFDLYSRKFMVKFINSVLAQVTPFLFYCMGGYLALRGSLDVGQLVAVIAAYRDLPQPVKELIDWDQQRLDIDVKYQQVLQQFSGRSGKPGSEESLPDTLSGTIEVRSLTVRGTAGETVLHGVSTRIALGSHVLLRSRAGNGGSVLALVLGRRIAEYEGSVTVAGRDLARLSEASAGRHMAYFGPDVSAFSGTLRDNVLYSLLRDRSEGAGASDAQRSSGEDDAIDEAVISALAIAGLADTVYLLGLNRKLTERERGGLEEELVGVRHALHAALRTSSLDHLVETFSPERYILNATIGENILFGAMRSSTLRIANVLRSPDIQDSATGKQLYVALSIVGIRIAETMIEIFQNVSVETFFFERFSFVSAADLPRFTDIVTRWRMQGLEALSDADRPHLIELASSYCEPRHRLGLLTAELEDLVLTARAALQASRDLAIIEGIEFFDPTRYCTSASIGDNLLFGRVDQRMAGASELVTNVLRRVVRESGFERRIQGFGLEAQTGPGGRFISPAQRSAVALARCLVKRPSILVVDQLLSIFGDVEGRAILDGIRDWMAGGTVLVTTRDEKPPGSFDAVLSFEAARLLAQAEPGVVAAPAEEPETEQPELRALRAVPMFSSVDYARLKLIALASERLSFEPSQVLFRQGDRSDSTYILMDGTVDILLELSTGPLQLASLSAYSIVGEMGVITGAARSATVVAKTNLTAIRIPKEVFVGLLLEFPQITLSVMKDQISRIVASDARFATAGGNAPAHMPS
jgi:putative ABC transport system ATP-binding protein